MMESGVCQNCFIKLNEYDEHMTQASYIEEELLSIMNSKEGDIEEEIEYENIKVEETDENIIHEDSTSIAYDPYENDGLFLSDTQDTIKEDLVDTSDLAEGSGNLHFEIIVDDTKENVVKKKSIDFKDLIVYKDQNQKYYQCDICQKICKDKSKLKTHREIHTDERNVECPDCGKRFKTANCLRNHKRLHVAERPYFNCDQCDKKYTQKIQLKKHIEIVHMQRRDYSCVKCGATFGTNSVLKMHLLSHQEFRAEKCNVRSLEIIL